jgi:hypothetical protein
MRLTSLSRMGVSFPGVQVGAFAYLAGNRASNEMAGTSPAIP